jgi:exopolysaccharide production protein ExoQ
MQQVTANESANSLAGMIPHRNLGTVGYLVIPGIAYCIVLAVLCINFKRVTRLAKEMWILSALALLTIASAIWSQNPSRSFYNGVFYLIGTLFAFYLVLRFEPEEIMSVVKMTGIAVCTLSLLMVIVWPQYAVGSDDRYALFWKGIFIDRTSAAKALVFLVSPAFVTNNFSFNPMKALYVLFIGTFVVMAHAVTSLVVLILYVIFMFALHAIRRFERRSALLLCALATPIALAVAIVGFTNWTNILHFVGRDATLTGRTELWAVLIPSALKQSALGYGFYAYWLGLQGESANAIVAAHWFYGYAHNGFLEIVLQLGFVGLSIFAVTLLAAFKNAWTCVGRMSSIGIEWYIGIIFLTVLFNLDEATVVLPNELLSVLYVVACTGLAVAVKRYFNESTCIN